MDVIDNCALWLGYHSGQVVDIEDLADNANYHSDCMYVCI